MFSWYSLELPSIRLVEAKRNRIRGNDSLSGYFVENNTLFIQRYVVDQ
mgnify:CR=1